jgi:glycosyltransferase involved in cell wall biosynthesis
MVLDLSKTLIVMPAFNEEAVIADVLAEVFATNPGITCLVVDDGSNDRTSLISREAGAIVAALPYNLGVGGAMRVGFNYALANDFENVVQVDADGQHNPRDVSKLVSELKNADLVLGARFAGTGDYEASGPRKLAMIALAKILSRSANTKLNDTTSGFRASGPRAVQLFAKHYPAEYLGDTVESLVIAARVGLKIRQVPVSMRIRAGGTPSHGSLKASIFLIRVGVAVIFAFLRPPVAPRNVSAS